jgi:serine/threonine protein phosphatase PrpC
MTSSIVNSQVFSWATCCLESHIGCVRQVNEDRGFLAAWPDETHLLAVVADGMGGTQGGEKAAEITVGTLQDLLRQPLPDEPEDCYELLLKAFYQADEKIREEGEKSFNLHGMGATAMAAIISPSHYLFLYAGDCRLYHFREDQFLFKSKDHSIVQLLVDLGELEPRNVNDHPLRSVVSSCLGGKDSSGNSLLTQNGITMPLMVAKLHLATFLFFAVMGYTVMFQKVNS